MKKPLYLLLTGMLCLVFSLTVSGQATIEDVVYLKNGNIIRGLIIEQIPDQSIKIQTKDNSLFVFKIEEVEKITKESTSAPQTSAAHISAPSSSDTITIVKNRKFYQNGHQLSRSELSMLLKNNPEAYSYMKAARGYSAGGAVVSLFGALTMLTGSAIILANTLNTNESNSTTTGLIVEGAGVVVLAIGLAVSSGYKSNMKKAVVIYNKGLKNAKQPTASIKAGFTNTGLGIIINF